MNEQFDEQTMSLPSPKPKNKFLQVCEKIGKRNFAIAGTVVLLGAAVLVNWVLFSGGDTPAGYDGYGQDAVPTDNASAVEPADDKATFFSATQVSRQRARDEALEVLQNVVDDSDIAEEAKADALAGISTIAEEIQKESSMESLITAKGYESCIAVLNGNTVSIIVSADSLEPAELAQINAIVYETTGISPKDITVMTK